MTFDSGIVYIFLWPVLGAMLAVIPWAIGRAAIGFVQGLWGRVFGGG